MARLYTTLLFFGLLLCIPHFASAQDTLYYENLIGGGTTLLLNTSDSNSVGASGYNSWKVNADYVGGTDTLFCMSDTAPYTVGATPVQPVSFTDANGMYLHISSQEAFGGVITNATYAGVDNNCRLEESNFVRMNTDVNTTNFGNVGLHFYWMNPADSSAFGEVFYSIDQGASWQLADSVTNYFGQNGWTQTSIQGSTFNNQATLRFGFRFSNTDTTTVVAEGWSIDEIVIEATNICMAPSAGFSLVQNDLSVSFVDTTQSDSVLTTVQWYFGDGNDDTAPNPTNIYPGSGTYTACLVATSVCGSDSVCQPVVVTCPGPSSTFLFSTLNYPTIAFNSTSTSSYGNLTYLWDFGDGTTSTQANINHDFIPGVYTVCLVVYDSCSSDTFCQTITQPCDPNLAVNFSATNNLLTATFTDGSTAAHNHFWDFGDATTSTLTNPTHTYASSGIYYVCLVATDSTSCTSDTLCQQLIISCPVPVAAINADSAALRISFPENNSVSLDAGATWTWDFGDGVGTSTDNTPTYTYANDGTYNICLTVNDQCGTSTACDSVTVVCQTPTAGYTFTDNSMHVEFVPDYNTADPNANYLYTFGNGDSSISRMPTYLFAPTGIYQVCQYITDMCGTDSICATLNICEDPNPEIFYTNNFQQITFGDSTTGPELNYWLWEFGDGQSSSVQHPVHQYAASGIYQVCLTVGNPCDTTSTCTLVSIITNGIETNAIGNAFELGPNPTKNTSTLFWNKAVLGKEYMLCITNTVGQTVFSQKGTAASQMELPTSSLTKGTYFISVQLSDGLTTKILLKQ